MFSFVNINNLSLRSKIQAFFLDGVGNSNMSLNRQLKFLTNQLKDLEEGVLDGEVTIKANLVAYTGFIFI